MDPDSSPDAPSDAERRATKLIRRQKRNLRKARAEGYLAGICAMLRPGDLALDCGANVGAVTGPLADTGCDVVAYEPDPWAFAALASRMEGRPNVTLVNAAIGAASGSVRLRRAENFDDNPGGASVKSTILDGGRSIGTEAGVEVPLVSFASEIERHLAGRTEIAFVKMDIEGAELEILEDLVERDGFGPIRSLVAETHENKFKDLRPRFRALRRAVETRYPRARVNLDWI